jgi:aryl-alcohol dehydrogenase-like predicted oxidoreductase
VTRIRQARRTIVNRQPILVTRNGMACRSLGSTGLHVSRLGLGLAALGRPAYINLGRDRDFGPDRTVAEFEQRCHEMLDAAYASGIRYVDAARSYGMAEAFLASWLKRRELPEHAITIGSKWGYTYVGSWRLDAPVQETKELSLNTLRRQIAESRALLGNRLCLYQIHSATLASGVLDDLAILRELDRLRSLGLAIGLTVTGPQQSDVIHHALHVNVDGANPFQVVQATWNLLEPSAGAALADAKGLGWGVIIKEALANGRLTDADHGQHLIDLKREAVSRRTSIDALALSAALSQPWADVVLSGAVTVEQLDSNVTALTLARDSTDWPMIAEPATEYWARRSALRWQ